MKKKLYLVAIFTSLAFVSQAQNVGVNTDGSDPDGDAILHIKNDGASGKDSSVVRIENEQNGANDVTGLELFNSGTGTTAKWDVYIPASGSTDLRIKNNGTDRITIQNDGDVGIGTTSPTVTLDVDGDAIFNESGNTGIDFRIESDANTHMFYLDGTNNEIGVNTSTPASTIDIQGSMGLKVTTITSATTLDQTHNVVLFNTGPYIVTLPAAASNLGKVYYIKNNDSDGDYFTLDGNGSETINGSTTYKLNKYNHSVRIISDGSNWHIIDEIGKNNANYCGEYFEFTWNPVTNPKTGRTWMDRNLGAKRAATSTTDSDSYGDLYQWGRAADGHQCRNSTTTTTLSSTNGVGHGNFIISNTVSPFDWRSPQNDNLWQGVSGTNNPCPGGYRVPTQQEWIDEYNSWTTQNADGAFNSLLKISYAGKRGNHGSFAYVGVNGIQFWTSTVSGTLSVWVWITGASVSTGTAFNSRATASSIRCIKD